LGPLSASEDGLEVIDLSTNPAFYERTLRSRNPGRQTLGMTRLVHALLDAPETILQQLVNSAVEICGADSAGISVEHCDPTGALYYKWEATAGVYQHLLHAILPSAPSACGRCLDRGGPQLFRVSEPFFELMQVKTATVTDGLLLPWNAADTRGTIWIVAHGRHEAFDRTDLDTMTMLATFAAMGVAAQERRAMQNREWAAIASAALVDLLAMRIREPVQKLADLVFIAANGKAEGNAQTLAQNLADPLELLTKIVEASLGPPPAGRPN
jgi:hypothetical protein